MVRYSELDLELANLGLESVIVAARVLQAYNAHIIGVQYEGSETRLILAKNAPRRLKPKTVQTGKRHYKHRRYRGHVFTAPISL